jgi:hypothetical protein
MRCPLCGLENLPYAETCDCGFKLMGATAERDATTDSPGDRVPESYFTKRESKIDVLNALFSIGRSVRILRGNFDHESKKKAKKMLLAALCIICISLLAIVEVLLRLRRRNG